MTLAPCSQQGQIQFGGPLFFFTQKLPGSSFWWVPCRRLHLFGFKASGETCPIFGVKLAWGARGESSQEVSPGFQLIFNLVQAEEKGPGLGRCACLARVLSFSEKGSALSMCFFFLFPLFFLVSFLFSSLSLAGSLAFSLSPSLSERPGAPTATQTWSSARPKLELAYTCFGRA